MLGYQLPALLSLTLGAALTPAWAQVTYRCGNSYSHSPCPEAVIVNSGDTRTPAQKAQADAATQRDIRAANAIEKTRQMQEAKSLGGNTASPHVDPVSASPRVNPASASKSGSQKSKKGKQPAALVVKSPAPPKMPASAPSAPKKAKGLGAH